MVSTLVGKPAPYFEVTAVMPDGSFQQLRLDSFAGKYILLFFYPMDFTFVCPSEIIAFDKAEKIFKEKNVQLLGCSIDSHFVHQAWRNTTPKDGGIGKIQYPLLADVKKEIASAYGVLMPEGVALRGLFLIDKQGIVQHSLHNNMPLGRSVDEAIRVVDALQHTEEFGEVCPANWSMGSRAMKASAEGVREYLSQN